MSDRSRSAQTGNSVVEGAASLPGISAANEPVHGEQLMTQPANQSDLATASISSKEVMRVSQRIEPRQDLHSSRREQSTSTTRAAHRRGNSPPPEGILDNPTYRYGGDLLTRFITLLANILKFIERVFLRLLSGPDSSAATPKPQNASTKNVQSHHTQHDQDRERKERQEKDRSHVQTIRRG